ncbi:MAG: hypothetical protein JWM14_889 [Chitinophagaceae bacterium]|nr:hypothetical protein [Chitinophagaceae bacterium]
MYKFISLLITLLILPWLAFSQISFTESAPYKTYTGNYLFYFQSGDEMLGFKRDGDIFILQKYNTKTLVQSSVNTYKDMPAEYLIEYVKEFNKRFYFFYSTADRAKKTSTLYCREINFTTGTFVSQGNVFVTVASELKGSFFVFNSLNDEKLMVQYTLLKTHMNDDINPQTIGFHVYDKNLQPIWETEAVLPYAEKYVQFLTQAVDSNGDIYYLIRLYDKETTDKYSIYSEKAEHQLELLKIEKGNKTFKSTKFTLSSNEVRDITLVETVPNEMTCVGFYNLNSPSVPSFFTCKVKADGSANDDKSYNILASIVRLYENKEDKTIKKDENNPDLIELNNFICNTIKKDSNGDLLIIAECINGYTLRQYDDLLIIRIDQQNNMKWMHRLPKRPFMHGSAFSYKYFSGANNDYVVFLDHEENKNLRIDQIKAKRLKSNETVLTAYKINKASGNTEKIILLDTKEANGKQVYRITSERVLAASATELILEAYKKNNEDVLIKIKGIE